MMDILVGAGGIVFGLLVVFAFIVGAMIWIYPEKVKRIQEKASQYEFAIIIIIFVLCAWAVFGTCGTIIGKTL